MLIPNTNCNACVNSNCLIKQIKNRTLFEKVNTGKRTILLEKEQKTISEGLPFEDFTVLLNGKIKVFKQGFQRKIQVIRFSKSGDIIGHRALYQNRSPVTAQTLTKSELCFIPKTILLEVLENDISFSNSLLKLLVSDLFISEELTRNHAQMSIRELVADTIIRIYNAFGNNPETGAIDVFLTRQEIAEIAGTTKEQVSKFLYEFKNDGFIEIKGKQIFILSNEKLKNLIEHHRYF